MGTIAAKIAALIVMFAATLRECLELTKGQYDYEAFKRFFEDE